VISERVIKEFKFLKSMADKEKEEIEKMGFVFKTSYKKLLDFRKVEKRRKKAAKVIVFHLSHIVSAKRLAKVIYKAWMKKQENKAWKLALKLKKEE